MANLTPDPISGVTPSKPFPSKAIVGLWLYFLLTLAYSRTAGFFAWPDVFLLLAVWGLAAWIHWERKPAKVARIFGDDEDAILAIASGIFLLLTLFQARGEMPPQGGSWWYRPLLYPLFGVSLVLWLTYTVPLKSGIVGVLWAQAMRWRFPLFLLIGLILRYGTILSVPQGSDVTAVLNQGTVDLLAGQGLYAHFHPYFPGSVLTVLPATLLWHDARWAYLVYELLLALGVYGLEPIRKPRLPGR